MSGSTNRVIVGIMIERASAKTPAEQEKCEKHSIQGSMICEKLAHGLDPWRGDRFSQEIMLRRETASLN